MERQREYVLRTVEERGVRLIRLWFTDVLGQMKSFAISPAELDAAFTEGMHFDGSAIDGFSRIQESDVLAMPDPTTFEILPWGAAEDPGSTAAMFCDITDLDGTPFAGDPRHVLKRNLAAARDRGYNFYVAPEMEFFYFESGSVGRGQPPKGLDEGSYFDLTTTDVANDLRKKTIHMLEALGIPVEYSFHEDSPSQHEIDLRYTDALSMADNVMACRLIVREIAMQAGVHATFMPKPLEGVQGSGMHTHISLFEGDTNAFHDPEDPYQLSAVGKAFMAGVLRHAREMTAVTNQLVNSYKRLLHGTGVGSQTQFEAPVHVSWGRNNRSALVRVPVTKPGKSTSTRLEYRAPDPACNPYLAFSVLLAAGLKGIDEGYELPPEAEANVWTMSDAERAAEGIVPLPTSLSEAIDEMERSDLVREALGEHIFEWFLRNKRAEWDLYRAQVTPFELTRYLGELVAVEPLLVYPDPPPPVLSQGLDLAGYPWTGVGAEADIERLEPADGWPGAVILAVTDPEGAFAMCRALRKGDIPLEPVLLIVSAEQLPKLDMREDLFDDFCVLPFQAPELDARLRNLFHKTGRGARPELVEYGDLALNLETYQAAISGKPLDLTYMEYELLKFLASHPGKVFTRETLLSRVWGYEYYGGARTVDVHVRRLRAKLGEEHAGLIQTVRSVGYRFGQSRWMG